MNAIPLCIDLDGTLTPTDTLWELVLNMVKHKPYTALLWPAWLLRGRAYLKQRVAEHSQLDSDYLPYRTDFLEFLKTEHSAGRTLVLVTAADKKLADKVAQHVGIFSDVLASDGNINLAGKNKAAELVKRFGERGFDYAGNSRTDIPVWYSARESIVTGLAARFVSSLPKTITVTHVFPDKHSQVKGLIKSLRPHQWIKNILVFIPLLLAHRMGDVNVWGQAVIAFAALSLTASSLYVLNDLLDLPSDRRHRYKKYRPLAAGHLSPLLAILAIPLLLCIAFGLAFLLPLKFVGALVLYGLGSGIYSFYFKRIAVLDVLSLAALFTLRIILGGFATEIPLSGWFLAFSGCIFFSGALVKRFMELVDMPEESEHKAHGRGYTREHLKLVNMLGMGSGYLAVTVLALYVMYSPEVDQLYSRPARLWLLCPLLFYWITHAWRMAGRGQMHADPMTTLAKDKISYAVAVLVILVILIST